MLTMTFISISRTTLSLIIQTSHISGETFRKILPSKLTKIFIEKEMFWSEWKYLYLETKKAHYRLHHTPLLCNTFMIFWYFDEFQYLNVFPRFDIWKEFFLFYIFSGVDWITNLIPGTWEKCVSVLETPGSYHLSTSSQPWFMLVNNLFWNMISRHQLVLTWRRRGEWWRLGDHHSWGKDWRLFDKF